MHFVDYGSERIVDVDRLLVLSPQFCSLNRQGVRCRVATAAEAGSTAAIPASLLSRASLEELVLNKMVVIKVLLMTDEDTCRVMLPHCAHNDQLIPALVRSLSCLVMKFYCCFFVITSYVSIFISCGCCSHRLLTDQREI